MAVLAVLALAAPAQAQESTTRPLVLFGAEDYLSLFHDADLRGVTTPSQELFEAYAQITGDPDTDARIRSAAEQRGYVRQAVATAELARVEGRLLQPMAAEAWSAMVVAARSDGVALVLTSAHRSVAEQRSLFLGRLGGATSDAAVDAALRFAAPPGYSKHHTGFAIDIGQPGAGEGGFLSTHAYAWLSAYDFFNAKRFGFIPSYPIGGSRMGPDPEAWEFVWVGPGRIACAVDTPAVGFCDTVGHPRAADIEWLADRGVTVGCAPGRFCVDDMVTRGEAAAMIWRLYGGPTAEEAAPFLDVYAADPFAPAVDWLHEAGLVQGTSATTFSPDDPLSPGAALELLVRLDAQTGLPLPVGLRPAKRGTTALSQSELGELGESLSRGEFATALRVGVAT